MTEARQGLYLLLDDRPGGIGQELGRAGWSLTVCCDLKTANSSMDAGAYQVGMVLLGNSLSPRELDLLEDFLATRAYIPWVAMVDHAFLGTDEHRELICRNFHDYHTAPFDITRLLMTLGHAAGIAALKKECFSRRQLSMGTPIIGKSQAIQKLVSAIRKVARAHASVLITGESGTGKELAARALHQHSPRAAGPFVVVNCGALPPNLIQAELFGHEKGAFTGALTAKKGLIEAAAGGTIFLDEIGDFPFELQANLLRFLQEKTINRVGSTRNFVVDVRVIAATHVDLESAVAQNRFREDLYYRLNVLHLYMPPLRERCDDIELLAQHFLKTFSQEQRTMSKGFTRRALQVMQGYIWPGNVRELMNRIHRALVMSDQPLITPRALGLEHFHSDERLALEQVRALAEREAIQSTLQSSGHNISKAARNLGISRVTLYRLLEKHDIAGKAIS